MSLDQSTALRVSRCECLHGTVIIPGDKSISHRSLMLGALAKGETTIRGLLVGEDPLSTAACFRAMGAEVSELNSELVTVRGVGLDGLQEPTDILDAGNSGTTLRLMLGILAAQQGRFFAVTGDGSLRSRPMQRVVKPLQQMQARVWGRDGDNLAPLAVQGARLVGMHYQSPVASAQVKSCVLLAGLWAEGETTVTEPALSRDHSERMLRAFGADVIAEPATRTVTVRSGNELTGQAVVVPGDISSAAFWLVAGAIAPDANLLVENVGINPTRIGALTVLEQMGARLSLENQREVAGEPIADVRVQSSSLTGTEIGGDMIPTLIDEIPILAVAAAFARGKTTIRDAAELRVKESDRLTAISTELAAMGVKVEEHPDGLDVWGGQPLTGTTVKSYGDHRIAMSLAIAALQAEGTTEILGADCAAISYPEFVPTLQQLAGASVDG